MNEAQHTITELRKSRPPSIRDIVVTTGRNLAARGTLPKYRQCPDVAAQAIIDGLPPGLEQCVNTEIIATLEEAFVRFEKAHGQ